MTSNQQDNPELHLRETRTLCDEHGLDRVVTMPRIYWGSYDFIIENTWLTVGDLLAIADEEAPQHNMTWHEYFPEGLAHVDHFFSQRPELWNCNRGTCIIAGTIGTVSKLQIEQLEADKATIDVDDQLGSNT